MLSSVRLLELSSTGNRRRRILPTFFTATRLQIKILTRLEDEQVDELLEARELWFKERTPLSEQLDALLLETVRNEFSLRVEILRTLPPEFVINRMSMLSRSLKEPKELSLLRMIQQEYGGR